MISAMNTIQATANILVIATHCPPMRSVPFMRIYSVENIQLPSYVSVGKLP